MHKQGLFFSENIARRQNENAPRLILISAFFFIGCVLGAFFGTNSSNAALREFGLLSLSNEDSVFLSDIFRFVWFHLLAILLGTSFLGVGFLPLLAMLKGFVFSCASATIITSSPSRGIIMALITLGIPSLFSIPAFIALSDDAFFRSAKLLSLLRGDSSVLIQKSDRRILVFIPILLIGFLADIKLAPYLLTLVD